jgi:hypothetical protein
VKEGLATDDDRRLLQDVSEDKAFHRFNNLILPISMIPEDYGTIRATTQFKTFTRYIVNNGKRNYEIDISQDKLTNKVTILGPVNLSWIDTQVSALPGEDGTFKRDIGKSTKYFLDGVNILNKQILPAKAFRKTKIDRKKVSNFVTMDIETIKKDGKQIPYLVCGYNGTEYITSYAKTSLDQKDLFSNFIDQLLSKDFAVKNRKLTVYAHNLSGFDGILLMKHLLPYGKVKPLLFNGKLMSIRLTLPSGRSIVFKDSYLLLPLSLKGLSMAFNLIEPKGHFPFNLTQILYTGVIPAIEYWSGISLEEYGIIKQEHGKRMWDFKAESIKYCQLDCKCLHEVLIFFNDLIYTNFKLNIHTLLTLPALAMKIYKTHFLPKKTIYQLSGEVEANIRRSYTGGAVDVYIPHNRIGSFFIASTKAIFRKLYSYDVNSLYPTVMSQLPMPTGKPVVFEGDIRRVTPDAFGIFQCNITTPDYLEHPILQRKIKGKGTVAGLGNWTGWISSLEMDNAVKLGYTFEILRGYQFNRTNIFSGYVNKMYNLRLKYPKGDPMNLIAKLLMNSLYGKFGMKLENTVSEIYNLNTDTGKLALKTMLDTSGSSVLDFIEFDNNNYLFLKDTTSNLSSEDEDLYHGPDVNIAIASTISAGARVFMSQFKNNPKFRLYYSDTDSIVVDTELDPSFIGTTLGQLKLEHVIERAVFVAPKVYGLVDTEGNESFIILIVSTFFLHSFYLL